MITGDPVLVRSAPIITVGCHRDGQERRWPCAKWSCNGEHVGSIMSTAETPDR
jgi:hypothetical protein